MNKAAQKLGRMAKGVPKELTDAEIDRRKQRLADARKLRWAKPANTKAEPRRQSSRWLGRLVGLFSSFRINRCVHSAGTFSPDFHAYAVRS